MKRNLATFGPQMNATDLALIPLQFGPDRSCARFELTPDLARHDGALYGGTGAAAAVMIMEAATERDALWVATQFIAQARVGECIEIEARTLAMGKHIAQLSVEARVEERIIFTALGSTALPRPHGLTAQLEEMPRVASPDESESVRRGPGAPEMRNLGFSRNLEFREAVLKAPTPREMALWARLTPAPRPMTRAGVAYVADMVPGAIARGAGKIGGGFSLDNALRFADVPPTEWVLLQVRGDVATNGYGHGSFTAWSSDGVLLATGGQTASMQHIFDGPNDPRIEAWRDEIAAAAEGATRD